MATLSPSLAPGSTTAVAWIVTAIGARLSLGLAPGEPPQRGALPPELLERQRGRARHRAAGLDVAHHAALGGDPRARADLQMAGDAGLPAGRDERAQLRAARD